LAAEIKAHLPNKLIREGLMNIAEKFASPDHIGPESAADFEELPSGDQRAILQRDAYEKTDYLLKAVEIRPVSGVNGLVNTMRESLE